MLRSYSRNDEENVQSDNELNLDSESSRPQRNSNLTREDFRSLLTNSRENSAINVETIRLINEEISVQMFRRLNEIKTSLNSHLQDVITSAITSTVNTKELILPWWTKALVGYNGTPKQKTLRKRGELSQKVFYAGK